MIRLCHRKKLGWHTKTRPPSCAVLVRTRFNFPVFPWLCGGDNNTLTLKTHKGRGR